MTSGLIQYNRSDQDKRNILLSLTTAGLSAVADLNRRASAKTLRMLAQLGEPQRRELLSAMQRGQELLVQPPAQSDVRAGDRVVRATTAHLGQARRLLKEYFDVIGVVLRDDQAAIRAFLDEPGAAMWIAYVDCLRSNDYPQATIFMRKPMTGVEQPA